MNWTTTAALLAILALSGAAHDDIPQPTRTIEVHALRFAFEPAQITVKQGETVRLHLISDDVPHSLVVKELGIDEATSKSHPGDAEFKATRTGDFAGRCGRFCGSGHGHMTFTVHVTGE